VAKTKVEDEVNAKEKPKTKTKHRGHQEGSINKRKDGRWSARIQITDPITGERKRPEVYGKTRAEVKDKLTKMMSDHQMGINIAPDKITLSTWIEQWLNNYVKKDVRQGTFEGYETYFRNHIKDEEIGKTLLTKLTTNDLQKFYNSKAENGRKDGKPLSRNSIRLVHFVINSALKQAQTEGNIPRNVAEFVRLPNNDEIKQKDMRVLSPDQITIFLNGILNERLYTAFHLELGSGMRRGELLALRWQDIDLETCECRIVRSLVRGVSGIVRINEPKTKKSKRNIILPSSAIDALRIHKVNQTKEKMANRKHYAENDLIFCDELGDFLKPDGFVKSYKRLLKKCNLPIISFHELRHSVATALLSNGTSAKEVQELFGHSKVNTVLDIYSHVIPEIKNKTAESLNNLLPKQEIK